MSDDRAIGDGHEHCWHAENQLMELLGGGTAREICCQCGVLRSLRKLLQPPEGHGPYITLTAGL